MPNTSDNSQTDNIKVGHAGLYVDESNVEEVHKNLVDTMGAITETIVNDIPLGIDKGGKTLIDCEQGIKAFVRDALAGTSDNPVDNHLPNTETGVWIYYLTKGIERDFGRTWEKLPKSIAPKLSSAEKKASAGKRVITKAEKNDLLLRKDMGHWLPMVSANKMTIEEAAKEVAKAAEEILELEKLGIYLSENKTAGVNDYNSDRIIIDSWGGSWDALEIMKKNQVRILIPNVIENFFFSTTKPKVKYYNALAKSALSLGAHYVARERGIKDMDKAGKVYNPKHPQFGGMECKEIETTEDFWGLVPELYKKITTGEFSGYEIKGVHFGKLKPAGKDNAIIIDGLNIKDKKRVIFYATEGGGIGTIFDDVWYNTETVVDEAEF